MITTNLLTTTAVHDDGATYTASGMQIPADEVHARRIAREAEAWLSFATERTRMRPETLVLKAMDACAFSVARRAGSLAVPTKLAGTADHQRALWGLVNDRVGPWAPLDVDDTGDGLAVRHGGDRLGEVQPKHLGWARPLVPFGLRVYLSRVSGHPYEGYTLGCNVVLGHVGAALGRLLDALGEGDGQVGSEPVVETALVTSPRAMTPPSQLRLVVRPEPDALRPGADPLDVVLWRSIDGTAHASVTHVPRHSPMGVEWGYGGSGPADLALSVLTSVVGPEAAEARYQAFKAEVVASVPHAGGVLRAADVRAWAERHDAEADGQ